MEGQSGLFTSAKNGTPDCPAYSPVSILTELHQLPSLTVTIPKLKST